MKTENSRRLKLVTGFFLIAITWWGCTNDVNDLGKGLLLPGDLVNVKKYTERNIQAYTVTDDGLRTDEPAFNLLGTYNDPLFGKTTADFACQFRLPSFPEFGEGAKIDSLILTFLYREIYGDTITPQRLRVYELAEDLSIDNKYYQDIDLKAMSKGELLGERWYVPKFKLDSLSKEYGSTKKNPKDTVIQEIRIKMSDKLIEKLMAADTPIWSDNDLFLSYFKGLYVEAGDIASSKGAILKINTLASGSRLALHYHNAKDDSLVYTYRINENSARISRFAHDYSKARFAAHLNKTDVQDSLIYMQTTGGVRAKILIPNFGTWRDSTNFVINKAEIVFQVDSTLSDPVHFLPPEQLVFAAIGKDDKGNEIKYLPSDLNFSKSYFGGTYRSKDKTYRFNIASHLQDVIKGVKGKENMGFYLATSTPSSAFRRVVLKGATSKTGIRLEIVYSKIK